MQQYHQDYEFALQFWIAMSQSSGFDSALITNSTVNHDRLIAIQCILSILLFLTLEWKPTFYLFYNYGDR